MISLDEELTAATDPNGMAGWNAQGDAVGVRPLLLGRGRIWRGDRTGVRDFW